jgi:Sulfotransferase family
MEWMAAQFLPNFFIVGAGKAGTTSLHRYLSQHPQIYMSPVKEPCYFASEVRPESLSSPMQRHLALQSRSLAAVLHDGKPTTPMGWLAGDWAEYLRLFQHVQQETAIGEASAIYLWSASAPGNIQARVPDAKIIMILRSPAERAFSQYLHQVSVGLTRATFREHIQTCMSAPRSVLGIHYPFLEIGLYSEQVKRYLDRFPKERLRIYWYEEAWSEPGRMLRDLFEFLNVDTRFQPDLSLKSLERRAPRSVGLHYFLKQSKLWYPLRRLVPSALRSRLKTLAFRQSKSIAMDAADRRYLIDYYRDDIGKLASLLNRDLSAWVR